MPLVQSTSDWHPRIVAAEPVIETRQDALYVPATGAFAGKGWGLYDAADRLVVSAATWSGDAAPSAAPASGDWIAPSDAADAARDPRPDDPGRDIVHVYAGMLEPQSGSLLPALLLDVISRFWSHATGRIAGTRILLHTRSTIEQVFEDASVRSAFAAFGVTAADCVAYERPVRLANVVAPAPAFERGRLVHRAFARIMATLRLRLAGDVPGAGEGAPLHLSHARSAHPSFADEAAFDAALEAAGIAVLHPSACSLAFLAARLREASVISSSAGEAELLAALAPASPRLVIAPQDAPHRDAILIDAVTGHRSLRLRIADPDAPVAARAAAFLRALHRLREVERRGAPGGSIDLGLGRLDGLGWTARRSSEGEGAPEAVLGGRLTGRAQMSTGHQQRPWWQLDFDRLHRIDEVTVHAPLAAGDADPARALTDVRLMGSIDGQSWDILARHRAGTPIGGIDGGFHVFARGDAEWRVRHLRVQAMHHGVLALDQIELRAAPETDPAWETEVPAHEALV